MMIDCGAYQGGKEVFDRHVTDLLEYVEGEVDILLITHEHQDHVLGFQRCEQLFKQGLKVKELWLAWTENEKDERVKQWKEAYGKKKKSLALALAQLEKTQEPGSREGKLFRGIYPISSNKDNSLALRKAFVHHLKTYTHLNVDEEVLSAGAHVGSLKGLKVVKALKPDMVRYLNPGEIMQDIEGLENIRIHVLGPPQNWLDVKTEHGKDGETYKHNKELEMVRGMSAFDLQDASGAVSDQPFDPHYFYDGKRTGPVREYRSRAKVWRRIDFDWLFMAGELSLRLTRGINNLSVVLAIEFVDSGKVMLFPGDAEFGSWRSWHEIKWPCTGDNGKHLTEDLLNRTIFYKVAHHLSHNGTAKEQGLDMMTSPELTAMATVDYDVISKNWKNTMPNRAILRALLQKTKGKLIVMNTKGMFIDKKRNEPLQQAIENRRKQMSKTAREQFEDDFEKDPDGLYYEYTVNGG